MDRFQYVYILRNRTTPMTNSHDSHVILPPEALKHYDQIDEANRLTGTRGQLELVRTQELLSRFLPEPPARILDVGGGAGIHSFWLADREYDVHLVDAVPHHIELAEKTAQERARKPLSMQVGDARQLQFEDETFDAVLLFGPLYHLTSRDDRLKCLQEAHRVLRPSGIAMGVGIPRFASTINCLCEGAIGDSNFRSIIDGDLRNGQHRNPTDDPTYFTTTFFHHPDELTEEFQMCKFQLNHLLAVEGPR